MKKILALLTALALLCSMFCVVSAASYTNPTIALASANAAAGEEVTLTLDMYNNPGIIAIGVDIDYDATYLTLTKATAGSVISGITAGNDLTAVPYKWNGGSNTTNESGNGTIFTYVFKVADNAPAGAYDITVSVPEVYEETFMENVVFDCVKGTITVEGEEEPAGPTYTETKLVYADGALSLEAAEAITGKVLVVTYTNDGKTLVDVDVVDVDVAADTATPITFSVTAGDTAKAMLWADVVNCMPLADAIDW